MADRIGVINRGEIILVEEKAELMRKLGKKQMTLQLHAQLTELPASLAQFPLELQADGHELVYTYDTRSERTGITTLLAALAEAGIRFKDLSTTQSSLEEIFVSLVQEVRMNWHAVHAIYSLRDGAHVPHDRAEHRRPRALDVAVLRRVRLGHRLAHPRGRRHELRRVHRAGLDHAVAADGEHRQRVVRHLLPALHRHDLRGAVGARVGGRGDSRATSAPPPRSP